MGSSPTGALLIYDAERRLTAWQNAPTSPTSTAQYLYDGKGHRLIKEGESMALYQELFMDIAAALPLLGVHHGQGDLLGQWDHKLPWNVPGPLYTGEVDNSGPGPYEAPNNIFVDADGFPFIFRQPVNLFELRQVLLAADRDPFRSYGADGNDHWDLAGIRAWWRGRHTIDTSMVARQVAQLASGHLSSEYRIALDCWREYLQHETEVYLRVYAFFLEEGRVPGTEDHLPDL